jgi:hypothetical protein
MGNSKSEFDKFMRNFILFLFLLITNSKSFSQERINEEYPKVLPYFEKITNINSWQKNEEGQWVKSKHGSVSLIPFLSSIEYRQIKIKNDTFLLVILNTDLNKLDGYSIIAGGDPYIKYNESNNIWLFEELEYAHSSLRYYEKNNLNGSPFILSYTPEMMLSFLLDPKIVELGSGLIPGKTGSNSSKSYVYNNGSEFNIDVYDFVNMSRVKYTGYEKINSSPLMDHPNMKIFDEFWKKWNGEYLEPYQDVVKRLSVNQ